MYNHFCMYHVHSATAFKNVRIDTSIRSDPAPHQESGGNLGLAHGGQDACDSLPFVRKTFRPLLLHTCVSNTHPECVTYIYMISILK